jgi:hypothetical protein
MTVTTAPFQIFTNSSFAYHSAIRYHSFYTEKELLKFPRQKEIKQEYSHTSVTARLRNVDK